MLHNPNEFETPRVCGRPSELEGVLRRAPLKVTRLLCFWVTPLQACAHRLLLTCFHALLWLSTSSPAVQPQAVRVNQANQGGLLMSWGSTQQTLVVFVSRRNRSGIRLREAEAEHPVKVTSSSDPLEFSCISTRPGASSRLFLLFGLDDLVWGWNYWVWVLWWCFFYISKLNVKWTFLIEILHTSEQMIVVCLFLLLIQSKVP